MRRLHIIHVVYSFRIGGLENGMVNLVNRLPRERFTHTIVALTDIDREFCKRIVHDNVRYIELHKPPGPGAKLWPTLYRVFRELAPDIVHSRNLAALEATLPAMLARVPVRIHGEHGRDVDDPFGDQPKPRWIRRAYSPFVTHYIALSRELENYLKLRVGLTQRRISLICNGVDAEHFTPASARAMPPESPFQAPGLCVIGTVGRLQAVKDQVGLVRAFARLVHGDAQRRLRLVIVGEGQEHGAIEAEIRAANLVDRVWLAGARADVAAMIRSFDLFVLPSIAEGISNTVLEAMACGLPVVATAVGGNPELVEAGRTGDLVPASDPHALAAALRAYVDDPARINAHGKAARARIEAEFSLDRMVYRYRSLYESLARPARA